jgi:hypothetical protein
LLSAMARATILRVRSTLENAIVDTLWVLEHRAINLEMAIAIWVVLAVRQRRVGTESLDCVLKWTNTYWTDD